MSTWCSGWNSHRTDWRHPGTFARCLFGLLVWTWKADAAGFGMGSESRFGKAGVVSLSAQVLVCFRNFAPAHRKLLLFVSLRPMRSHETVLSGCRKGDYHARPRESKIQQKQGRGRRETTFADPRRGNLNSYGT